MQREDKGLRHTGPNRKISNEAPNPFPPSRQRPVCTSPLTRKMGPGGHAQRIIIHISSPLSVAQPLGGSGAPARHPAPHPPVPKQPATANQSRAPEPASSPTPPSCDAAAPLPLPPSTESTRSTTIAEAPPPPLQMAATPMRPRRCCSTLSSVTSSRVPEAPIGCPSATAPPKMLTLQGRGVGRVEMSERCVVPWNAMLCCAVQAPAGACTELVALQATWFLLPQKL